MKPVLTKRVPTVHLAFEDSRLRFTDIIIEAGKIIYSKGSKVIASGWNPIRNLHREIQRDYAVIVKFPSEKFFQECLDEAEKRTYAVSEKILQKIIYGLYMKIEILNHGLNRINC